MNDRSRRGVGTPGLHALILATVGKIPRGKVATYGEIASLCGLIGKARLVGYALHAAPPGDPVPWHRVINAQGKISLPAANGLYGRQRKLLRREGVILEGGRIDLSRYGWLRTMRGPEGRRRAASD